MILDNSSLDERLVFVEKTVKKLQEGTTPFPHGYAPGGPRPTLTTEDYHLMRPTGATDSTSVTVGGPAMPTLNDETVNPLKVAHFMEMVKAFQNLRKVHEETANTFTRKFELMSEKLGSLETLEKYLLVTQMRALTADDPPVKNADGSYLQMPSELRPLAEETLPWTVFRKVFEEQVTRSVKSFSDAIKLRINLLEVRMQSLLPHDVAWNHYAEDNSGGRLISVEPALLNGNKETVAEWSDKIRNTLALTIQAVNSQKEHIVLEEGKTLRKISDHSKLIKALESKSILDHEVICDLMNTLKTMNNDSDEATFASRLTKLERQAIHLQSYGDARKQEYGHMVDETLPLFKREMFQEVTRLSKWMYDKAERGDRSLGEELTNLKSMIREGRAPVVWSSSHCKRVPKPYLTHGQLLLAPVLYLFIFQHQTGWSLSFPH